MPTNMPANPTLVDLPPIAIPANATAIPQPLAGEFIPAGRAPSLIAGVLVLIDVSGSMSEINPRTATPKYVDVSNALADPASGLVARLRASSKHEAFQLGVLPFADRPHPFRPWLPIDTVTPKMLQISAADLGPATSIGGALREAHGLATSFVAAAQGTPREVVVLLMSDGEENRASDPEGAAAALQAGGIKLACAAYGDISSAGARLLERIASRTPGGKTLFASTKTGEELRDFFHQSATQATQ